MTRAPHLTRIKVRGYHLDGYGHVNHARYLEFLEEARWSYIETGRGLQWWHDQGLGFVVAAITINYKRPVGPGADLEIRTAMTAVNGRRAVIHQDVVDAGTGKVAADADVTFAIISLGTGRAVTLDGERLEALGGDPA